MFTLVYSFPVPHSVIVHSVITSGSKHVTRCSESYVASRRFIHAVKCAECGVLSAEC